MEQRQELVRELTSLMKERKYKKKKQTWYKEGSDLIIIFNVQNSCYGENYYINLGIIIKKLMKEQGGICLSNCHIQERVNEKDRYGRYLTAQSLMLVLDLWEQWYGNLSTLRIKAVEGKLPHYSTAEARTFLTTVRLG